MDAKEEKLPSWTAAYPPVDYTSKLDKDGRPKPYVGMRYYYRDPSFSGSNWRTITAVTTSYIDSVNDGDKNHPKSLLYRTDYHGFTIRDNGWPQGLFLLGEEGCPEDPNPPKKPGDIKKGDQFWVRLNACNGWKIFTCERWSKKNEAWGMNIINGEWIYSSEFLSKSGIYIPPGTYKDQTLSPEEIVTAQPMTEIGKLKGFFSWNPKKNICPREGCRTEYDGLECPTCGYPGLRSLPVPVQPKPNHPGYIMKRKEVWEKNVERLRTARSNFEEVVSLVCSVVNDLHIIGDKDGSNKANVVWGELDEVREHLYDLFFFYKNK